MISWLVAFKGKVDQHKYSEGIYLIPLTLCCALFYYQSLSFDIHDYSVSYFTPLMLTEGLAPETIVFDIHEYNQYIWNKGYTEEISDYYLNSPFLSTIFYPLAWIENPYLSKAVFNAISILLFLSAIYRLAVRYLKEKSWLLLILPFVFLMPLRNQILFGQSYMLVFALVSFGFLAFEKGKYSLGGGLVSLAVLTKIFPVFYLMTLVFQRNWKAILTTAMIGVGLLLVSWFVSGAGFWQEYLFDVLPGALASESTTDFRSNAQSIDVFFRTLLVQDNYYNPGAFVHNPQLYKALVGLCKAVILGFTLHAGFLYRKDLFRLLAIWVAALFLLQTRTGTYAQILWIIPLIEAFRSSGSLPKKILFPGLLFLICNLPYPMLIGMPVLITFLRLWLSIALLVLFWRALQLKPNLRFMLLGLFVMLPLTLRGILTGSVDEPGAEYVLKEKKYFMLYDFQNEGGYMSFGAIGNQGDMKVKTDIEIQSFDSEACNIREGQVFYGDRQLTYGPSLKSKPVLINGCEVYYLSDRMSRRAAFTLKKINVCDKALSP